MKTGWLWIQTAVTAIGGFLGWYLGGMDSFLYALVVFVAVDYLTGIMCAIRDKKLSSKIGSHGIYRKVMVFLLVGIANMIDSQVIGHDSVLRTAVIFFYLSNEGISILENAAHLGLPVPTRLKGILAGLHSEKEEEKDAVLESGEVHIPDADMSAVVNTVREAVRFSVRETLMEAASEIGVFPPVRNAARESQVDGNLLPEVLDADSTADLSGEGDEQ